MTPHVPTNDWGRVATVAREFELAPRVLYAAIDGGHLPFVCLGDKRGYRVRRTAVATWLGEREHRKDAQGSEDKHARDGGGRRGRKPEGAAPHAGEHN